MDDDSETIWSRFHPKETALFVLVIGVLFSLYWFSAVR
jgi:hypothetical protein